MHELCHAFLKTSSPNYSGWREILGGDRVPLKSGRMFRADLGADRGLECYLLDVGVLPLVKRARLLDFLARNFRATASEIDAEIARRGGGFPIRADDLVIARGMKTVP